MPGAMHRMGVYLGLVEDEEYTDDGEYGHAVERAPSRREDYAESRYPRESHHLRGAEVAHIPAREYDRDSSDDRYSAGYEGEYQQPTYQITALHPRTYNEARTIGEHFRKSTPVIMNLSEMDDADAKRLVDFAAGLVFGLHG
ncbi:MAG: cell division protein SepF, partial [Jatrophihabitantaceae bacterium]